MKLFVLSLLVGLAAADAGNDTDSTKNGDDVNTVVFDIYALKDLVGCFLDTSNCDYTPSNVENDISELVNSDCAKCTQAQKDIFRVFFNALKEKLPKEYKAFKNKYDPAGTHLAILESAVK